jgi:hypothetical protein
MKSFKDELRKWQQSKRKQEKPKKKQQEKLSEQDIKELMGMNRAIYSRGRGGAFRQR